MRAITDIQNFDGQRVIVRTDWNVPHDAGTILDTSRVDVTLKTIRWVTSHNGAVIVVSHFGRQGESMKGLSEIVSEILPITFVEDPFSEVGVELIKGLKPGEIILLENIRKWPEEEANDEEFAKKLASLADIYVNEAFSNSHRNHASMVGIPRFLPSYAGLRFLEEVSKLSESFNPEHPFLFILGGAKLETKLPLIDNFLNIADQIFVGGALAKPASLTPLAQNPKIVFPKGDIAALDADSETLTELREMIRTAKFVLWNGPLGNYEKGYNQGTKELARMLAESGAKVIAGGGDTENVIDTMHLEGKFYFISLAGGAMLDFLAKRTLPAIEALQ